MPHTYKFLNESRKKIVTKLYSLKDQLKFDSNELNTLLKNEKTLMFIFTVIDSEIEGQYSLNINASEVIDKAYHALSDHDRKCMESLHWRRAAYQNDISTFKVSLPKEATHNILTYAVSLNNPMLVKAILNFFSKPNEPDWELKALLEMEVGGHTLGGHTPLMFSRIYKNPEIFKILLEAGAEVGKTMADQLASDIRSSQEFKTSSYTMLEILIFSGYVIGANSALSNNNLSSELKFILNLCNANDPSKNTTNISKALHECYLANPSSFIRYINHTIEHVILDDNISDYTFNIFTRKKLYNIYSLSLGILLYHLQKADNKPETLSLLLGIFNKLYTSGIASEVPFSKDILFLIGSYGIMLNHSANQNDITEQKLTSIFLQIFEKNDSPEISKLLYIASEDKQKFIATTVEIMHSIVKAYANTYSMLNSNQSSEKLADALIQFQFQLLTRFSSYNKDIPCLDDIKNRAWIKLAEYLASKDNPFAQPAKALECLIDYANMKGQPPEIKNFYWELRQTVNKIQPIYTFNCIKAKDDTPLFWVKDKKEPQTSAVIKKTIYPAPIPELQNKVKQVFFNNKLYEKNGVKSIQDTGAFTKLRFDKESLTDAGAILNCVDSPNL